MRLLQFVCFKTDICAVTCFFRNSAHVTCKSTLLYEPRNGSNNLMSPLLQSSKHDDLDYPGLTFEVCLRSIHLFTPLLHSWFDISSCLASFSTLPHHHSFPPFPPFPSTSQPSSLAITIQHCQGERAFSLYRSYLSYLLTQDSVIVLLLCEQTSF